MTEDRVSAWGASRFARPGTGWADVGRGLAEAAESVTAHHHGAPLPAGDPVSVLAAVTASLGGPGIPDSGIGESEALSRLARLVAEYGLDLTHPLTAAHLQPAPLSVAVVADALASATNASTRSPSCGMARAAWSARSSVW